MMNIENITLGQLLSVNEKSKTEQSNVNPINPMIGRRCVVRCYSAGVHIGRVQSVDGTNVHLTEALRLWKWKGSISLSPVARLGIESGRLEKTEEVFLTEAIELIPVTEEAWNSYAKFIEK